MTAVQGGMGGSKSSDLSEAGLREGNASRCSPRQNPGLVCFSLPYGACSAACHSPFFMQKHS